MLNTAVHVARSPSATERPDSPRPPARTRHADDASACGAFEQRMRDHVARGTARRLGAEDDEHDAAAHGSPPPPLDPLRTVAPPPLLSTASALPAATAAREPAVIAATQAALEAALTTPSLAPAELAAAKWEVSIPQPWGVPLELRADRGRPVDGSTAWTLDIRGGRDLQPALARFAPRLSERLEARSLHAHVRIERHREEDQS